MKILLQKRNLKRSVLFFFSILFVITLSSCIGEIKEDKSINITVPFIDEKPDLENKNTINVFVKKDNEIILDDKKIELEKLTDVVLTKTNNFLNTDNRPEPGKHIFVTMNKEKNVDFKIYILVYNNIRKAFNKLRDTKSQELFNKPFDKLGHSEQKKIKSEFPMQIIEDTLD